MLSTYIVTGVTPGPRPSLKRVMPYRGAMGSTGSERIENGVSRFSLIEAIFELAQSGHTFETYISERDRTPNRRGIT